MKTHFYLSAALLLAAATLASCDSKKKNDPTPPPPVYTYQVASFADEWDSWAYTYNADGKVEQIDRNSGERVYNFAYSGNNVSVSGYATFTMVLGQNGYVASMVDQWDDARSFTYDAKGHMLTALKDTDLKSTVTIADECIASWTRYQSDAWQTKNHTFDSAKPNTGAIHNIYSEAAGVDRWLFESGLFGKPSAFMCSSSQWTHSTTAATYSYEYDDNGCATREIKAYGTDEPEIYTYTFNKITVSQ
ncbi:hypothetical protein FACS1894159_09630 [Bacteroidia bacterium]|nr:hypothetical protein FACS1894159_09630 [Bacteroidia bacterium]